MFKDTRLMKSLLIVYTVMHSAPMTGQLSSFAHKVYDKGGKRHTLGMGEWSVQGHNADA